MLDRKYFCFVGSVVDVGKLLSQLSRSENCRVEIESQLAETSKSLAEVKDVASKHASSKDKLQVSPNNFFYVASPTGRILSTTLWFIFLKWHDTMIHWLNTTFHPFEYHVFDSSATICYFIIFTTHRTNVAFICTMPVTLQQIIRMNKVICSLFKNK